MNYQWYPGHMTKAKRMMQEDIKLIDLVVEIVDAQGKEFARGICNYSNTELAKIKGQKSKDICPILGYKDFDEAIHRDNLSLIL